MADCASSSQRSILDYFSNQNQQCAAKRGSTSSFAESSNKKFKCDEIIIISDDEEDSVYNRLSENSKINAKSECSSQGPRNDCNDNNEYVDLNKFLNVEVEYKEEAVTGDRSSENIGNDFKLNIFKSMISEVMSDSQFGKLFNDEDWNIIQRFTSLSGPAQRLFVRVYVRKRDWKRNLSYKEICDDLSPFLNELVTNSFLLATSELRSLKTALNLLDLNEIKVLFKEVNAVCNGTKTKEACINAILDHVRSNQTIESQLNIESSSLTFVVLRRVKKKLNNSAFRLNDEQCRVFDRMTLLYFPPDVNDDEIGITFSERLYSLMSVESGEIRYPSFEINRKIETFQTRNDLINYEECCQIERDILDAKEKKNLRLITEDHFNRTKLYYSKIVTKTTLNKDRQLPDFIRRLTSGYILTRCLSHIVEVLESLQKYEEAVKTYKQLLEQTVYCLDYRGKWYERLTINYEKRLKDQHLAFETVCKALQDSKVRSGQRLSMYNRGLKLKQVLKRPFPRLMEFDKLFENIPKNTIEKRSNEDVTILSVEEVALTHYKETGYVNGVHCEEVVYWTLFGLLFWDIIYYSGPVVKDSFRSRCQTIPLDLNYDTFFNRRKDLILQRLNTLRGFTVDEINAELEKAWNENFGCLSLVDWQKCNLQQLHEIIRCTRGLPIIEICARMASEFRYCRSGFPDLLVWNPEKLIIMAVEVKGPGDQLSPKQVLWIDYFNKKGLTAEVCYVTAKKKV